MSVVVSRHRLLAGGVLSVVVGAICSWPAMAADGASPIPDLSGRWARNAFDFETLPSGPAPVTNLRRLPNGAGDGTALVGDYNNPILKSDAAQIVKKRGEISLTGHAFPDPSNQCLPYHPPYAFSIQLAMEIVQEKDQITILYNQDDQVRRVRLNGTHPSHVVPSAMGDSIGRFEGDTLVVDTVGIKTGPFVMIDRYGTPQSEALHLVERYRLIDAAEAKDAQERHEKAAGRIGGAPGAMPINADHGKGLQLHFTVDDPNVFTTPWSAGVTYRRTTIPWEEQICAENFREYYDDRDTNVPQTDKPDF